MADTEEPRKPGLTPKQAQLNRIAALRRLAKHLGLISDHASLRPTPAELDQRVQRYGTEIAAGCLQVLAESDDAVSLAAVSVLLECFWPTWREEVDPRLAGAVVHRDDKEATAWRRKVLERDGNACTECKTTEGLHAHHIVRWADAPRLRLVVDNGLTLCRSCHEAAHAKAA